MAQEEMVAVPEVLNQEDDVAIVARQEVVVTPELMKQGEVAKTCNLPLSGNIEDKVEIIELDTDDEVDARDEGNQKMARNLSLLKLELSKWKYHVSQCEE